MKLSRLVILIAEDDENDVILFKRAIKKTGIEHEVYFVSDGQAVIEWLGGTGEFADRNKFPFPNIFITDLKMPKKSGMDVLQWLTQHEECNVIPTIVFSSSAQPEDIQQAYRLAANSYFTKPSDVEHWSRLLKTIFDYWFESHVPDIPVAARCR